MTAVFDDFQDAGRSGVVAEVVAGVCGQSEVAIHQGHEGQRRLRALELYFLELENQKVVEVDEMWTTVKSATEAKIGCVPHQTGVIFAGYCHHSAVVWNLLTADPFDADVGYFFKITKGLPLSKHTKQIQQKNAICRIKCLHQWSSADRDLTAASSQLSLV